MSFPYGVQWAGLVMRMTFRTVYPTGNKQGKSGQLELKGNELHYLSTLSSSLLTFIGVFQSTWPLN